MAPILTTAGSEARLVSTATQNNNNNRKSKQAEKDDDEDDNDDDADDNDADDMSLLSTETRVRFLHAWFPRGKRRGRLLSLYRRRI